MAEDPHPALPSRVIGVVRDVVRRLFVHHAFDHAATMAFYFFLGTIPLMVLGGLIIGHALTPTGAATVVASFDQLLPGAAADLFHHEVSQISASPTASLAPLSILGFLWLTSNGFHNLMDVFELLIGARRRSWWRQRVIAVASVAAVLLTGLVSLWLLAMTLGWIAGVDPAKGWQRAFVLVSFAGLMTVGIAIFYRVSVVHPRVVRRRVWAGTIVAMLLWALVTWAFATYVRVIGNYAVFYGSLATVAVTLFWFYLSSLAFLIGAELNAQLEGVREPGPSPSL